MSTPSNDQWITFTSGKQTRFLHHHRRHHHHTQYHQDNHRKNKLFDFLQSAYTTQSTSSHSTIALYSRHTRPSQQAHTAQLHCTVHIHDPVNKLTQHNCTVQSTYTTQSTSSHSTIALYSPHTQPSQQAHTAQTGCIYTCTIVPVAGRRCHTCKRRLPAKSRGLALIP